jgi:type IX secretion system PorP/SprF family membrane protein
MRTPMRKLWLVLCAGAFTVQLQSQSFSLPNPHFANNRYAFNPSLAGSWGYTYVAVDYRKQHIGGVEGTPQHGFVAIDIPFQYRRHNIGFQAYGRQAGLFSNSFLAAHYALQLMPSPHQRFRLGFGGGMKFTMLDTKAIDPTDPVLQNWKNKTEPLLQAGISYNSNHFWIGFSLQDILYKEPELNKSGSLSSFKHYNAFMSYKFIASEELFIETALLHRSKEYDMPSVELNITGTYQNKYWLGASYRNDIGATVMAGFKIAGFFSAAFGYKTTDFINKTGNSIRNPAMDILLGFHLGNQETAKEEWIDRPEKSIPISGKDSTGRNKKDSAAKNIARKVVKGTDSSDLNYNHYVVVGVFSKEDNARNFTDKVIKEQALPAKIGYNSITKLYYVYIYQSGDYESSHEVYQKYRGTNQFGDIWILRIVKNKDD